MIVIAHNIRSLHNVGAILRSSDAFGIEKVYLTGFTGMPPRKEISKVALGSDHRINWEGRENIFEVIHELKKVGRHVIALDNIENAVPISQIKTNQLLVLVLGNEVEGLEKAVLDECEIIFFIEMPGAKQSLNVSVAAGVAMFALTQLNQYNESTVC